MDENLHDQLMQAFAAYFSAYQKILKKQTRKTERAYTTALRNIKKTAQELQQVSKDLQKPIGKPRANNIAAFNAAHKGEPRGIVLMRQQEKLKPDLSEDKDVSS